MENLFSSRRWTNQIYWRRSGTENIHLDTGTSNSRRSKRFSWKIRRVTSTTSRLTSGCRWSDKWLLVHVRKLQKTPSRWTQSQTLLAERRIIPYSTETHWRLQNYTYDFGCQARETHRRLLEHRWTKRFVWFSRRIFVVGEETDKKAANVQARSFMARTLEVNGKARQAEGEAKVVEWKLHLENERKWRGIYFIDPEDKEFKETIKNARKKLAFPMDLARQAKTVSMVRPVVNPMRSNQNLRVFWKPENPQDWVWEKVYHFIMRTILNERETIHCNITIWDTNLLLCLKPWRFPQQRQQWIRNGKNWKRFQRGTWHKSETNQRWSMKQGRRAEKVHFASLTSVIWLEAKHQKYKYSEAILWKMILDLVRCSLNRDHQHHKWQQPKSWISSPDYQGAQDKQLMQYLLIQKLQEDRLQYGELRIIRCPWSIYKLFTVHLHHLHRRKP